jgi:hypothetical protein
VRFSAAEADDEPPAATIIAPTLNQLLPADEPATLHGEATDNVAVQGVWVSVQDRATSSWLQLDGVTWGSLRRWLPTSLSNPAAPTTSWSFDWTPPEGTYTLQLRTLDRKGNVQTPMPSVRFAAGYVDLAPPDGTIASPTPGEQIELAEGAPIEFSGSATDDRGVAFVRLAVRDVTGKRWWQWDGTWGSTLRWGPTTLSAPGAPSTDWTGTWTPPEAGRYSVTVRADDTAGKMDPDRPVAEFYVTFEAPLDPLTDPGT